MTQDVSEGGIFLSTDTPPPLLQLVHVQLVLPVGGHALSAHGMTVHVALPGNPAGRVPGIGLQFYGLDPKTREAWQAFTRHVELHYPLSNDQTPLSLRRGETPEPLSRRLLRHTAVLERTPETLEALAEIYTHDVANGSMFVPSALDIAPGATVVVSITHPTTHAPFIFQAVVARRLVAPQGLDVELVGVDQAFREAFLDFVRGPINIDPDAEERAASAPRMEPLRRPSHDSLSLSIEVEEDTDRITKPYHFTSTGLLK
jgi:hypothetical protein